VKSRALWRGLILGFCAACGAASAADAPFLWQIKGPKAAHYLQGSVHMLPPEAEPSAALEAAYTAAEGLVFETDLDALMSADFQGKFLEAAKEAAPGGLAARIKPALYSRLQKRVGDWGLPGGLCDAFKAWFCAMTLEVLSASRLGFTAESGVDQRYYARARSDGKAVGWLEQPAQQLALFTQMPEPLSAQFLAATLDELTDGSQSPEALLQTWQTGDVATMEKIMLEFRARYPEAYARLLFNRNQAWLNPLSTRLSEAAPQLIIVGAAHLVGADGLVSLLKARGFAVEPVPAVATPEEAPPSPPVPPPPIQTP
jgi:hypothetical protein